MDAHHTFQLDWSALRRDLDGQLDLLHAEAAACEFILQAAPSRPSSNAPAGSPRPADSAAGGVLVKETELLSQMLKDARRELIVLQGSRDDIAERLQQATSSYHSAQLLVGELRSQVEEERRLRADDAGAVARLREQQRRAGEELERLRASQALWEPLLAEMSSAKDCAAAELLQLKQRLEVLTVERDAMAVECTRRAAEAAGCAELHESVKALEARCSAAEAALARTHAVFEEAVGLVDALRERERSWGEHLQAVADERDEALRALEDSQRVLLPRLEQLHNTSGHEEFFSPLAAVAVSVAAAAKAESTCDCISLRRALDEALVDAAHQRRIAEELQRSYDTLVTNTARQTVQGLESAYVAAARAEWGCLFDRLRESLARLDDRESRMIAAEEQLLHLLKEREELHNYATQLERHVQKLLHSAEGRGKSPTRSLKRT
jgi:hypothetical protein